MVEASDNLSLNFRPELNILVCRFIQPIPSALLRQAYGKALQTAQEYQARYWLFDLRRRGPISAEDEKWILEYFFPQAESQVKALQYFAYLVTPSHYVHIREVVSTDKLANYSPLTHISIFDSEDKALDWLALNQTADARA
ncbi:hypothetical protein [Adhaeribacter rhizoryzae]|uniref:STAS/SEC14 domain-containing protein n=1 Tax=Adhaeribacter rhizoryzae TaxID=2607907 RepID=A0A5M6D7Q7_9BACT|nr:hypothetical protein [Adhaeribacter rhizoryzae]KAA5543383.1 hypothetical protein F0145_17230 [Adhaeribacter rhizoryzae]